MIKSSLEFHVSQQNRMFFLLPHSNQLICSLENVDQKLYPNVYTPKSIYFKECRNNQKVHKNIKNNF